LDIKYNGLYEFVLFVQVACIAFLVKNCIKIMVVDTKKWYNNIYY